MLNTNTVENNISELAGYRASQASAMLLIADHALYREALTCLLKVSQKTATIRETDLSEEAIEIVKSLQPDLVLVDVCVYHEGTVTLIDHLLSACKKGRLLLILDNATPDIAFQFIRNGVSGIVLKTQRSRFC
jgi:DNA-binding NarL/FixJ family response regulator